MDAKEIFAERLNIAMKRYDITINELSRRTGINVKAAQRLLGHANFQTTMDVYTHLSDEHLKQAQEKLIEYLK